MPSERPMPFVNHPWTKEISEEARKAPLRPLFGPIGSGTIAEVGTLAEFFPREDKDV